MNSWYLDEDPLSLEPIRSEVLLGAMLDSAAMFRFHFTIDYIYGHDDSAPSKPSCSRCNAPDLEHFRTGKDSDRVLCTPCFDEMVKVGNAKDGGEIVPVSKRKAHPLDCGIVYDGVKI